MDIIEKATQLRQELHRIPECSGMEEQTKRFIKAFLRENTQLTVEDCHGGIIALYDAGFASDTIAFRADFDAVALPDGSAAHLCGHDGHTAALLGVAMMLEAYRPRQNVLLVFQPAEETGEGAKGMVDILDRFAVKDIYGCHNLPGFPLGQVYTSLDTFACASCGMIFTVKGEPAHAAYPETGISPAKAVVALLQAIQDSQVSGSFPQGTFATLIGCSVGQKAFGTSAENAEIWVTVRSRTENDFRRIKEHLENTLKTACNENGLSYSLQLQDAFPATVNHPSCAEKIITCCNGKLLEEPMRWSEDFGHFLNHSDHTKGAFFGIGAGECPALHTKDYQYPDKLLPYHIQAFMDLLR